MFNFFRRNPKAATDRIPETTRVEFWKAVEFCIDSSKVDRILRENPVLANSVREDGSTPLHHAAAQGHTGLVDMLLSRGAKVNAKNNTNPPATPLDLAEFMAQRARTRGSYSREHEEVIAILKKHGGRPH